MSKLQFSEEYECPICKVKGKLIFKKPDAFEPSVTRYNCKNCLTRYMVVVKKRKDGSGHTTQDKIQSLGALAKEIINKKAQEREARAKERAKAAMSEISTQQETWRFNKFMDLLNLYALFWLLVLSLFSAYYLFM